MKIDTQIQSQYRIQNKLKEHIKDCINERMEKHIKNIKNKNKIKIHTSNTIERKNFNKLMKNVSDNHTELTADPNSIKDIYNNTAVENFKNSSDYEEMWNIAIDKWTRNWNFYREHLTNSILEKFQLNNKRQKRQKSNCLTDVRKQNRIDILDRTLEIREVSLILNLDTEEISYMGTKLPCDLHKGECQPTPFKKATIVWEPQTHCQLFELIRFDAFMVKYQERYWIETNAEWTTVQKPDTQDKIKLNKTALIATRFEIYPIVEHECGSLQPLHKTEYDDIYIIYEYGFDMHTGQKTTRKKDKFDDEKFIKITPKQIISTHTRYEDEDDNQFYYGFINENTHLNMKMDLYMSNIYSRISLQE